MDPDRGITTPDEAQTMLRQQRTKQQTLQMTLAEHSGMQAVMGHNALPTLPEVLQILLVTTQMELVKQLVRVALLMFSCAAQKGLILPACFLVMLLQSSEERLSMPCLAACLAS